MLSNFSLKRWLLTNLFSYSHLHSVVPSLEIRRKGRRNVGRSANETSHKRKLIFLGTDFKRHFNFRWPCASGGSVSSGPLAPLQRSEGEGEGEVAFFSAKRWDRRNRADLIESATPCHDAQVVGPYRDSNPHRLTILAAMSEDYTTAPQHLQSFPKGSLTYYVKQQRMFIHCHLREINRFIVCCFYVS